MHTGTAISQVETPDDDDALVTPPPRTVMLSTRKPYTIVNADTLSCPISLRAGEPNVSDEE